MPSFVCCNQEGFPHAWKPVSRNFRQSLCMLLLQGKKLLRYVIFTTCCSTKVLHHAFAMLHCRMGNPKEAAASEKPRDEDYIFEEIVGKHHSDVKKRLDVC